MDRPASALNSVYLLLKFTFALMPIVAGLDKFFNLLTDWSKYLSQLAVNVLPFSPETFMMIVGVIEIAAGVIVLTRFTKWGAYIVSAWLTLIAINLIIAGWYDIAVRDLVMAIAAYGLAQLAAVRETAPGAARSPAPREPGRAVHA